MRRFIYPLDAKNREVTVCRGPAAMDDGGDGDDDILHPPHHPPIWFMEIIKLKIAIMNTLQHAALYGVHISPSDRYYSVHPMQTGMDIMLAQSLAGRISNSVAHFGNA